jgi:ABC-type uncharacterized transport system ATPase subunit
MMPVTVAVALKGITKRFPAVVANDNVDFELEQGEIHALVGENGAGKSTLMRILYGMNRPIDAGKIFLYGQEVDIANPSVAIAHGIGMIHQHFMLVPSLSVAENVVLGREPARRGLFDLRAAGEVTRSLAEQYNLAVDPAARVVNCPVGVQQRVEILKTLYRGAEILILDEPTAVLTPQEVEDLFATLRTLKADGKTVIFVSHKLGEVLAISDRVTVMRKGRVVGTVRTAETDRRELVTMMIGHELAGELPKKKQEPGETVLEVRDLWAVSDQGFFALRGINLAVRAGEIVGMAGVEGNGQTELVETITGLRPCARGRILLDGRDITGASVRQRRRLGMVHVPEDRISTGLCLTATVGKNLIVGAHRGPPLSHGMVLDGRAIDDFAAALVSTYQIDTPSTAVEAQVLSGGNLQRVVVAREFNSASRLLVAAQPTRGVDVGSVEFIHRQILEMRERGVAILLVSAELDEVIELSDRLLVVYGGQIVGEFDPGQVTATELGLYMTGAKTRE